MLPRPPLGLSGPYADYLAKLVRDIEEELRLRVAKSPVDHVVYLDGEQPISLISDSGKVFRLTINDAGDLVTTGEV